VILAIEVPLGIVVAFVDAARRLDRCRLPCDPGAAAADFPWNVVGTIWQIFGRPDIGLLGYVLNHIGINYNYVSNEFRRPGPPSL